MSETNNCQSTAAAEQDASATGNAELTEPARKKPRLEFEAVIEETVNAEPERSDLCERLRLIMLCSVCHTVPHPDENYQCSQGHIICDLCVTRILGEAAIGQKQAFCPNCRIQISWPDLCNSLALKQVLWEMPTRCPQCDVGLDFKQLEHHLKVDCGSRKVSCQYRCLGCSWMGPYDESVEHEASCEFPNMSGEEILSALLDTDRQDHCEYKDIRLCHAQLSARRVFYKNVELKFSFTSTSVNLLESAPLFAFEEKWSVIVQVGSYLDGDQCQITYWLNLMSGTRKTLCVAFMALIPALADNSKQQLDIGAHMYRQCYHTSPQSSSLRPLPMASPSAVFRLMAMPSICLRLWMFLK